TIIGLEGAASRAVEEQHRVTRRIDIIATERSRADAEHDHAERRREESVAAIRIHDQAVRDAETMLGTVLERLHHAREGSDAAMRLVSEARAAHATWTERVAGLAAEIARLEEAARDLAARIAVRQAEVERAQARRNQLHASVRDANAALDADVQALEAI